MSAIVEPEGEVVPPASAFMVTEAGRHEQRYGRYMLIARAYGSSDGDWLAGLDKDGVVRYAAAIPELSYWETREEAEAFLAAWAEQSTLPPEDW